MRLKQESNYPVRVPAGYVFRIPVLSGSGRISKTGMRYFPNKSYSQTGDVVGVAMTLQRSVQHLRAVT